MDEDLPPTAILTQVELPPETAENMEWPDAATRFKQYHPKWDVGQDGQNKTQE